VVLLWGSKVKGQGHRVSKFMLHTTTAIHRHTLGGVTSRQCGFEIGIECFPVPSNYSVVNVDMSK